MNTVTTELPTLTRPVAYRTSTLDNGLWYGAMNPTDPRWDSSSPDELDRDGMTYSARGLSIWNEAHNEDARRGLPSGNLVFEDPDLLERLKLRVAELEEQKARDDLLIGRLRTEQIKGDDPRLSEFWAEAQQLATDANQCHVFDDLAEELGGPRRKRDYSVSVDVSFTVNVNVTAEDEDDALEMVETDEVREAAKEYLNSGGLYSSEWEATESDIL